MNHDIINHVFLTWTFIYIVQVFYAVNTKTLWTPYDATTFLWYKIL